LIQDFGGATIFKNAYKKINADYIYMADTENAPYGLKSIEEVRNLTENCIQELILKGCNIIVVACNTATSAAIEYLRDKYPDITFIGAEPAIKPALKKEENKKIILAATSLTLKGNKLKKLISDLETEDKLTLVALDKLVEYSDFKDEIEYNSAYKYIKNEFSELNLKEYSGIVLGCTHFPIFKNEIRKNLPSDIKIFDSAEGITNNLKRIIGKKYPDYNENSDKSLELILTKNNKKFEYKFFSMINDDTKDWQIEQFMV